MSSKHPADTNSATARQLKVIRLYTSIAWLYLLIFLPVYILWVHSPLLIATLLIDFCTLLWVEWAFRRKPVPGLITLALSFIAALTVGATVVTGGIEQNGLFLVFPYIPFIIFLRNRAGAQRWLYGMLLFLVGLFAASLLGYIKLPYDSTTMSLGILIYLFSLMLTLAYVREKTVTDAHLRSKTKELVRINHKLSEAAQAQQQATTKAQAILRSIGEGVIVFDATGKVETANYVAEKLFGISEQQLRQGNYAELVKATDENGLLIDPAERPITKVIATKKTISTSLYYTRKGGDVFPAQITIAPIIKDGVFEGAIEVFRDIYREKEIDKSKTEFVSLASHQLRTPLSTISWYAEMLLAGDAGKITKEQARYVDEIYQSNRRMTELVGSLLNVSRIELGTFAVEPEPTDLVALSQGIVKDLEPQIFARKLNFQERYDLHIPIINADPKLMRMVIENLASNAIKYTPETGSITLHLQHHSGETRIIIKDTGLGIPPSQQGKIFSKLFRADNVKTQDTEGTGLGLYLVKSIVDYSGGKIWFKSKEGKGTTFFVSLPDSGMKHKQGTKALS